jgi:coproporphyrinogen III oxidase-like Fe-S oxidoreductase
MARRVARGELPAPDDDVAAARYELIDDRLTAAGLRWYEVSNWAATDAAACRHNLGYWLDGDWWGLGPGRTPHLRASAGGTSSTRPATPPSWPPGSRRRPGGRSSRPPSSTPSA